MDHRSGDKIKSVLSKLKGRAFGDHDLIFISFNTIKPLHHIKSLGRRNDGCIGVSFHKSTYASRMVRLHMLNNKIIRLPA